MSIIDPKCLKCGILMKREGKQIVPGICNKPIAVRISYRCPKCSRTKKKLIVRRNK